MARSRKHQKKFACGHRGLGGYCHTCAQQARQQERQAQYDRDRALAQAAWRATFAQDPIDLSHLPKHVVLIARRKIAKLAAGKPYRQLGGKRLRGHPTTLSVPVTRDYRLLCHITSHQITPTQVLSHEAYNKCNFSP